MTEKQAIRGQVSIPSLAVNLPSDHQTYREEIDEDNSHLKAQLEKGVRVNKRDYKQLDRIEAESHEYFHIFQLITMNSVYRLFEADRELLEIKLIVLMMVMKLKPELYIIEGCIDAPDQRSVLLELSHIVEKELGGSYQFIITDRSRYWLDQFGKDSDLFRSTKIVKGYGKFKVPIYALIEGSAIVFQKFQTGMQHELNDFTLDAKNSDIYKGALAAFKQQGGSSFSVFLLICLMSLKHSLVDDEFSDSFPSATMLFEYMLEYHIHTLESIEKKYFQVSSAHKVLQPGELTLFLVTSDASNVLRLTDVQELRGLEAYMQVCGISFTDEDKYKILSAIMVIKEIDKLFDVFVKDKKLNRALSLKERTALHEKPLIVRNKLLRNWSILDNDIFLPFLLFKKTLADKFFADFSEIRDSSSLSLISIGDIGFNDDDFLVTFTEDFDYFLTFGDEQHLKDRALIDSLKNRCRTFNLDYLNILLDRKIESINKS